MRIAPPKSNMTSSRATKSRSEEEDGTPRLPEAADSRPKKRAVKRKIAPSAASRTTRSSSSSTNVLSARAGTTSTAQTADEASLSSSREKSRPPPELERNNSGKARIILRIPSLAARQAALKLETASARPVERPTPLGPPPPTSQPSKRKQSPTATPDSDSDEEEFAASFMRKRKVSAAAI